MPEVGFTTSHLHCEVRSQLISSVTYARVLFLDLCMYILYGNHKGMSTPNSTPSSGFPLPDGKDMPQTAQQKFRCLPSHKTFPDNPLPAQLSDYAHASQCRTEGFCGTRVRFCSSWFCATRVRMSGWVSLHYVILFFFHDRDPRERCRLAWPEWTNGLPGAGYMYVRAPTYAWLRRGEEALGRLDGLLHPVVVFIEGDLPNRTAVRKFSFAFCTGMHGDWPGYGQAIG